MIGDQPVDPSPPARRRKTGTLLALSAIGVTAVIGAAAVLFWPRPAPTVQEPQPSFALMPFTVKGFLTLKLPDFIWSSESEVCAGRGGFDDIKAGAQVVVGDPVGKTVALGALDPGIPRRDPNNTTRATECRFPFTVKTVPAGHKFYKLQISHRRQLELAEDRIRASLELTL